jgi:hypothetical protein
VDNPPPRTVPPYAQIAAWQVTWSAQSEAPNAAWNVPAATADAPPPLRPFPRSILNSWQVTWPAQSAADNAGWNQRPPDNPPPRTKYQPASTWQAWFNVTQWGARPLPTIVQYSIYVLPPLTPSVIFRKGPPRLGYAVPAPEAERLGEDDPAPEAERLGEDDPDPEAPNIG